MSDFDNTFKPATIEASEASVKMKLIGVGGAGSNMVDRLHLDSLEGVDGLDLAVINTDAAALGNSVVDSKLLVGRGVTKGFGAGGEAEMGRKAAETDIKPIQSLVQNTDLLFLVAGLGGGTGSGVAPVVAREAESAGAIVIAFCTLPFSVHGSLQKRQSEEALMELRQIAHAVIALPNDIILQACDGEPPLLDAFALTDAWIVRGIRSIWSMVRKTGMINIDFSNIKECFLNRGGKTLFGTGSATGPDCHDKALDDLMLCPLLHTPEGSRRADSLLVHIEGGPELTLTCVQAIMKAISDKFESKENNILGAFIDESLSNQLNICVLGTTDIDGRTRYQRTRDNRRYQKVPAASVPYEQEPNAASLNPIHRSRLGERKKSAQEEFTFNQDEEQRGFFEKTERNLYDDEDLDVPTYLRRGIRVKLHVK